MAKIGVVLNDDWTDFHRLGLKREPLPVPLKRLPHRLDRTTVYPAMVDSPLDAARGKNRCVLNDGLTESRRLGLKREPSFIPFERAPNRPKRSVARPATNESSPSLTRVKTETDLDKDHVKSGHSGLDREPSSTPFQRPYDRTDQMITHLAEGEPLPITTQARGLAVHDNGSTEFRGLELELKLSITPFDGGFNCLDRIATRPTTSDSSRNVAETKSQAVLSDGWTEVRRRRLKREPSPSVIDRGPVARHRRRINLKAKS